MTADHDTGDDTEDRDGERGFASWTADTTARERIRAVATTLSEPRSVEWIRDQADVGSWETVADELSTLAEFGRVATVEGDDGHTKYAPNYQRRYFDELAALINDHTRRELRDQVAEIQSQVDEWRTEFDVESREELESTLTDAAQSGEETRRRNAVLRRWERLADDRRLLRHALELYDDARSLHPDASEQTDVPERLSQ
ncbi:hypothetical protein RYH80_07515 [Halobaculum sp. MBLA0147]|uniref:DUF7342 family protein n=1 Tax=Halobaculum sp. MBLA0147 TaxID=3079934 RepID=UPI003525CD7B